MIFALPSSPHCAPTTTVTGTCRDSIGLRHRHLVPGDCVDWCLAPLVGGNEHVGVPRCLAPSAVNGARHAQTRRALVLHRGEPGTNPRSLQAPFGGRTPVLCRYSRLRGGDAHPAMGLDDR